MTTSSLEIHPIRRLFDCAKSIERYLIMTIEWKEDYCTNVDRIDDQHRQLFKFVNELDRIVKRGVSSGPEVDHLMLFLGPYTRVHFSYEESCMHRNNCSAAKANKSAHREFLKVYDGIIEEYRKSGGSLELLIRLRDMMEKWLDEHICAIDVKLRDCIHSSGKRKAAL